MEELIRNAAQEMKWALDRVSPATWQKGTIDSYPHGACGHCAELLARYLHEKLGIKVDYASGCVEHMVDGKTHTWLEYDGIIIDISADQFGLAPVIVERASAFHEAATDVDKHPIIEDGWWFNYAAPIWDEVGAILREKRA